MEINAQVYVMAESWDLLKAACKVMEEQMETDFYGGEELLPNAVLPLKKVWYGFSTSTGPTSRPEYGDEWWDDGLRKCAQLLKKRGAVCGAIPGDVDPSGRRPGYHHAVAGAKAGFVRGG